MTFNEKGEPVVSWEPKLEEPEAALRRYIVLGKVKMSDPWTLVENEWDQWQYNFFQVVVEMR